MATRRYTHDDVRIAAAKCISWLQLLKALNLVPAGGNYENIKSLVKKLNINTDHFLGQGHNKGKNFGPKRPIEDYLSNKHKMLSDKLRRRLIREGYFSPQCCRCKLSEWQGQPIPLELEHKDGNHMNNNLDNLEILCPNCHALTPTYRGKNARLKKPRDNHCMGRESNPISTSAVDLQST